MTGNIMVVFCLFCTYIASEESSCRDRSNFFRQDGGLCFEIPPWQHQPVELDKHVLRVRAQWNSSLTLTRKQMPIRLGMSNGPGDISRYMDTVIAPFLDTYHRNIQSSYQQLTTKILRRIKEEINAAVKKKQLVYKELTTLANELEIPPLCDDERRKIRTVASNLVALNFQCTEDARAAIAKMGKYAEEMISITKVHMQEIIGNEAKVFDNYEYQLNTLKKPEIEACLQNLSKAAVSLGYELDLSLTNARRHSEQSCERLTMCSSKARKRTEENVVELRDLIYQCVYT